MLVEKPTCFTKYDWKTNCPVCKDRVECLTLAKKILNCQQQKETEIT